MRFPYLFNFAASDRGGGLKRLEEYSRWFHQRGGVAFAIHHGCRSLIERFPANRYYPVQQNAFQRLFRDGAYLQAIAQDTGPVAFYYAYGIPIYSKVAKVNWFHLSNVMPFSFWRYSLPAIDYIKQPMLARRYQKNTRNADVVSAESRASLAFLKVKDGAKLFVSVNGSDDELARAADHRLRDVDPVAVVVGAYSYNAIDDSYKVNRHLRATEPALRLTIIGVAETVLLGCVAIHRFVAPGFSPAPMSSGSSNARHITSRPLG